MKTLNKKGFTLIELLAVIVVLGIVMVIGTTTVLPLLEKSQKNAFATEANSAIESASNSVSLISLGEYEDPYYEITTNGTVTGYCFTLEQLRNVGFWKKNDITGYEGSVTVTKSGNIYTYSVTMHNANYKIVSATRVNVDSVGDYA